MIQVVPIITWVVVSSNPAPVKRGRPFGSKNKTPRFTSLLTRCQQGATRLGIPLDEYVGHIENGEKWCSHGKHWVQREAFYTDKHRADGLHTSCRKCLVEYIYARSCRNQQPEISTEERSRKSKEAYPKRLATQRGISESEVLAHIEAGERWCSWHKRWQPLNEFSRPIDSRCKVGNSECQRAFYAANRERQATYIREYQRRRRAAEKRQQTPT